MSDRIVFDKLIQVLVLGATSDRVADTTCSATTIGSRRDEWIAAGIFRELEQLCLLAYDQIVGLRLENLSVDGCLVKVACGGEVAGRSPVDRSNQGTKRSLLTEGRGQPVGCVIATANRHDSPLLRPTPGQAIPLRFPSCPRRSPCTWMPDPTAAAPMIYSRNSAVARSSARKVSHCRPAPAGYWSEPTPCTAVASESC